VQKVISQWLAKRSQASIELIVAHTHGHGDHAFGDSQFAGQPHTTVVKPTLPAVKAFFGLPSWPNGTATVDLGGRQLVILPLPGHEESHIAAYDSNTQILLTGDSLYPGKLTVETWSYYRDSAARLADFVSAHAVSLVLGAHVEMTKTPRALYPIPTRFQPDEHVLPLGAQHVHEWHQACRAMGNNPHVDIHDDFVISP
jgi:glyoxylase-like metal-dependent hydrolase (beta-lactamase superfamily II)